jgi:alpha-glucuronidase
MYVLLRLLCVAISLASALAVTAYAEADLWIGTLSDTICGRPLKLRLVEDAALGSEGYRLVKSSGTINVEANTEQGLMYGIYGVQRLNACGDVDTLHRMTSVPAYDLRILNHWDNLDGTVERGYAGASIWQWDELPAKVSPRYRRYAAACASIGINGSVLNNVNASPEVISDKYLPKVARIADELRPYGVRVYLSVNFASPIALGGLNTADPLEPVVQQWWAMTIDKIYELIPDFGGFLVKANSEGQPGPCDYGRSHADGANMLARLLRPHNGIVMWRAFVYSPSDADRAKQAYVEFQPLDGSFDDNVLVQIKNGPIDFQPREPFSPLFYAMPKTQLMAELQITQEYLGQSNHLAYLAPMWSEFFGYVHPDNLRGIAGVSNIGNSENWTGHPLAQANWYAFGRLAWKPDLSPRRIAEEWARLTLFDSNNMPPREVEDQLLDMMCGSREAVVNYMMPLGLHHLFAWTHHYGPEPWCDVDGARPDWMPRYYHNADSIGLGFDRTVSGSNAVSQYPADFAAKVNDLNACPGEFLLWFHHVAWSHKMHSGRTLWQELCSRYDAGVDYVSGTMIPTWQQLQPYVDHEVYTDVSNRLLTQLRDAQWWHDACLLYFQTFSGMPFPAGTNLPTHSLPDLMKVHLPISNYECPSSSLLDSVR